MVRSTFLKASLLGAVASVAYASCVKRTDTTSSTASSSDTTSSSGSTNTSSGSNSSSSGLVAATYFTGYHANEGFPVSAIPWDKYTDIKYSFAETTSNGSLDISKSSPDQLPVFVTDAKKNGVKALVSVGGWTGSKYFSTNFATAENRTAFAKTCMDFISQYELDGLDFDYEYPNRQGLGCNTISDNDTSNFLLFLQELRSLPGASDVQFTASASLFPWNDATGSQSADVSGFADVLDYIMIMNYDLYGMWSTTAGPNTPLASACDARNNQGSATAGINAWIAAGMPANKMVLGVAAYGHGFRVNATSALGNGTELNMYPNFNSSDRFQGSSWDDDPAIDDCGNANPPTGTYTFWSMITETKFLDEEGNPLEGIVTGYDECSQTPAVWNSSNNIFVSYDNVQSLTAKGQYILDTGLHGFAMWEAGGDHNNILINGIRSAVGLS